jgi:hypothetical protein
MVHGTISRLHLATSRNCAVENDWAHQDSASSQRRRPLPDESVSAELGLGSGPPGPSPQPFDQGSAEAGERRPEGLVADAVDEEHPEIVAPVASGLPALGLGRDVHHLGPRLAEWRRIGQPPGV